MTENSKTEAAKKAREERKAAGLKATLTPLEKLARNPKSLRTAINAKCFDCEGEDADPAWRWRIGNCQIVGCPLWAVRPYQKQRNAPIPWSVLSESARESSGNGKK